ncbi:GntR family transcriptional regulator [Frigoribacterium faeni]|nr:GntR family transcriptional regulator [Frigoribacterium faeni]
MLRDVVFDKLLAAIVDGTLEPGERLNDDDLTKWLGVSRTPVREAIAQLHTFGLVDIEANRFPRVARRDDALYAEATAFLAGLHQLAREWGLANLTTTTRRQTSKDVAAAVKQLEARDISGVSALLDIQGRLAVASGNNLLVQAEEPLRIRVKFLSPADPDAFDWDALIVASRDLQALVAKE